MVDYLKQVLCSPVYLCVWVWLGKSLLSFFFLFELLNSTLFSLPPCPSPSGDEEDGSSLFHTLFRWLERDTSTSLCVIPKPFFPWPFLIISAHYWRRTWSVTLMKRTRFHSRTLMRAWPTCLKGGAATPTPTMKAMCTNTVTVVLGILVHPFSVQEVDGESLNSLPSWFPFRWCTLFLNNNNTQRGFFLLHYSMVCHGLRTLFDGGW